MVLSPIMVNNNIVRYRIPRHYWPILVWWGRSRYLWRDSESLYVTIVSVIHSFLTYPTWLFGSRKHDLFRYFFFNSHIHERRYPGIAGYNKVVLAPSIQNPSSSTYSRICFWIECLRLIKTRRLQSFHTLKSCIRNHIDPPSFIQSEDPWIFLIVKISIRAKWINTWCSSASFRGTSHSLI